MIYLDNAATGGFKTNETLYSCQSVNKYLCANPGRSGHTLSIMGAKIVSECRENLAQMFDASSDRVVFTKNCTEALNLAIFGTLRKGKKIITTIYEHNSVLRPLLHLQSQNLISLEIVSPEQDKPLQRVIEEHICPNTYMVITTAVSNVTGEVLPINDIAKVCKRYNLIYMVDGAQGGGHVPLSIDNGISILALAGHKGLYGIMGLGALIFSENVDINPLTFGGTGTETFNGDMPSYYPDRLEAGTLNLPSIAALNSGIKYVHKNLTHFSNELLKTTKSVIERLDAIDNVKCYSSPNPSGIVAFRIYDLDSAYVADILSSEYDIAVRGGFHCAPKMHEYLGTKNLGLVRASFAIQNSYKEQNALILAVKSIVNNAKK